MANTKIGARLESVASDGIVAGADAIYDDGLSKSQAEINQGISDLAEKANYVGITALNSAPTSSTLTYTVGTETRSFKVGDEVRVADANSETGYKFYKLNALNVTNAGESNEATAAVWQELGSGTGGGTDTVTGVKVGSSGTELNPTNGVVTIPAYETNADVTDAENVKAALGTDPTHGGAFLRKDGTWQVPPDSNDNTTYSLSIGTGADANKVILTPSSGTADKITVPYASDAGTVNGKTVAENVPSGAVFTDTTYSTMGASGSTHAGGLVPDTPTTAGTTKFLREDGTWEVPSSGTDTTYKLTVNGTVNGDSANGTNLGAVYAPTTAGTSGQVLTSSGSGAPTWTAAPSSSIDYDTIDQNVTDINASVAANALLKTSQSLSSAEKSQVLTNLGIASAIAAVRNITVSTSEPTSSDGSDGDIWFVYDAS